MPQVTTIGSLFSGIGGLELGLERAGLGPVVWQCEADPWCRKVLAKHWPNAERFDDVATLTNPPPVDLICGGFPCVDISLAGKGAGLSGEQSGLWWEFARIIREARPRWVVIENVAALLARGLDAVLWSLAESGYDAVWDCIPAQAVGAPHRRDRLFVVARRIPDPKRDSVREESGWGRWRWDGRAAPFARHLGGAVGNADERRGRPGDGDDGDPREQDDPESGAWPPGPDDMRAWRRVPALSQPSICRLADGLPAGLVRDRRRMLRAYGNAVVPQVAQAIGTLIAEQEINQGERDA